MAKSSDYNFLFSGRTFDFGRVLANKIVFSRFFLIPDPPLLSSWFSNGGLETSCDLVTNATRNVMLLTAQSESPEMFQMPSISDLPTSSVLLPILARTLRYAVIWNAPARDALFRRRDFVLHLIYCKCGLVTMQKFFTIKVLTSFSCYIYQRRFCTYRFKPLICCASCSRICDCHFRGCTSWYLFHHFRLFHLSVLTLQG